MYRYCLYFVPAPETLLHTLGAAFIGRCAYTERHIPQPHAPLPPGVSLTSITEAPRRYGLHATLVAPFYLNNIAEESLLATVNNLCAAQTAVSIGRVELVVQRGFLALRPATVTHDERNEYAALCHLAAHAVRCLYPLQEPLIARELERRNTGLSARQQQHLTKWGYPYVFEEFDFHITLTNTLSEDMAKALCPFAASYFAPVTAGPLVINQLCVCRQPVTPQQKTDSKYPEPFTVLATFALALQRQGIVMECTNKQCINQTQKVCPC